jgi:hypothetical protein
MKFTSITLEMGLANSQTMDRRGPEPTDGMTISYRDQENF